MSSIKDKEKTAETNKGEKDKCMKRKTNKHRQINLKINKKKNPKTNKQRQIDREK